MYNYFNLIGKVKFISDSKERIILDVKGKLFDVTIHENLVPKIDNLIAIGKTVAVSGNLTTYRNFIICIATRIVVTEL